MNNLAHTVNGAGAFVNFVRDLFTYFTADGLNVERERGGERDRESERVCEREG